jgi:putative proteasome-type protease
MTFCLGMKVREGLVGIADTRITSGSEIITARKMYTYQKGPNSMFLMTSGLRSLRDKALAYYEEKLEEGEAPFDRIYKAVNCFSAQVRRVAMEDKDALEESNLTFNIHTIIGGQFGRDSEHKLYLVYPQGNWVEIERSTPYHIIGSIGYGKPILDRTLTYNDPMHFAFKVGCLAFDSTRISAANVDFPIDIVLYAKDSHQLIEYSYEKEDLQDISNWWQERLRQSINDLPSEWIERAFTRLAPVDDTNGLTAVEPR